MKIDRVEFRRKTLRFKQICDLMAINDKREDKAKLDRREFDLDAEEQDRQRKEREVLINKVSQS